MSKASLILKLSTISYLRVYNLDRRGVKRHRGSEEMLTVTPTETQQPTAPIEAQQQLYPKPKSDHLPKGHAREIRGQASE